MTTKGHPVYIMAKSTAVERFMKRFFDSAGCCFCLFGGRFSLFSCIEFFLFAQAITFSS
jgi:hypothetical protein